MIEIRDGHMHFDDEQRCYANMPESMPLNLMNTALTFALDAQTATIQRTNELLDGWYAITAVDRDLLSFHSRRLPVIRELVGSLANIVGPHLTDGFLDELLARS